MKYIITIILSILFTTISWSQEVDKLTLTPKGFVSKQTNKDYIIFTLKGQSKQALYQKSLVYFNSIYKSPKNVISKVENERITVNGRSNNSIRRDSKGHVFNMDYTITVKFNEDKIKVEKPHFDLTSYNKKQTLHLQWTKFSYDGSNLGIYGRKDKLKSPKAKEDLERLFNEYIEKFATYMIGKDVNNPLTPQLILIGDTPMGVQTCQIQRNNRGHFRRYLDPQKTKSSPQQREEIFCTIQPIQ
ncbi:hypothetical protein OAT16_00605 [Prolixibacteraceae bacterium]|nr:hypothetical protein [Prolixibacteraceae bacterium]